MLSKIDLNLLRVFDVVMSERSVTRAARVLHMTQPAVSNAVARLRHILADDVFIKGVGGITPTAKSEMIWPSIRASLRQISVVLDSSEFDPNTSATSFRLAMSDYVAFQVIRPMFSRIQRSAPNVSLHIRPHYKADTVSLLERGEIDLAAGVFPYLSSHIRRATLQTLEYEVAMRKDHPLASGDLTLERFLSARHLAMSVGGAASLIDDQLTEMGLSREIALTVNQFTIAPAILSETDLICVMPPQSVINTPYRSVLTLRKSPVQFQTRQITSIWHPRNELVASHMWLRAMISTVPPTDPSNIVI